MKNLKRLLGMLRPYWLGTVLAFLLLILFTAAEYVIPLVFRQVVDVGIPQKDLRFIGRFILIMIAMGIGRSIFIYLQTFIMERTSQRIAYDLRNKLYAHMQRLSFSYFDRMQTGQIMSRMTGDIECVRGFLGFGFINLLMCILNFIVTITLFMYINIRMAVVVLIPTPILIIAIVVFGKRISSIWESLREQMGKLTSVLQENITGIRVVKAFAREPHEKWKFDSRNISNLNENMKRAGVEANAFPLMDFLGGMNFLLFTMVGGYYVINDSISVGTFVALQWYAWGLIWPVRFSGWLVNIMQQAVAAAPRIFEILDTQPDIVEMDNAVDMPKGGGSISLQNVSYNFSDGQPALRNINLDVKPGEIIAVIGGTGSGKSTLVGLIPRFFDPHEGMVMIDGVDIRKYTLNGLRSRIGIVMQETFLFSDTIRENIAYGRPDASEEEIMGAAKIACIHNFIEKLPEAYSTKIGERGIGLSGGQKQRLAIARAVLMNPSILILDEATASVDTGTERAIQASMKEIMKGRTTLIIAQRLSTIKNAHRIVVMENGKIVETGTHDELKKREGYYSRIYDLQFKSQEVEENA